VALEIGNGSRQRDRVAYIRRIYVGGCLARSLNAEPAASVSIVILFDASARNLDRGSGLRGSTGLPGYTAQLGQECQEGQEFGIDVLGKLGIRALQMRPCH
jgi:hypothetical protein